MLMGMLIVLFQRFKIPEHGQMNRSPSCHSHISVPLTVCPLFCHVNGTFLVAVKEMQLSSVVETKDANCTFERLVDM